MSSAVFTVIGFYAALENKSNHWIAGVSLTAAPVLFVVASFLAWNEEHKKLEEEVAKQGRPEVVVRCDWPSNRDHDFVYDKSPAPPLPKLHDDLFKRNNLFVQVLTDIAATNVQVQVVALERGAAHFGVVSLLQKDKPEEVRCTIERPSGSPALTPLAWNLESLIYDSYKDKVSDTSDIANSRTPAIPILARYTDLNGRSWESVNELTYDLLLREGKMGHVKIRKAS